MFGAIFFPPATPEKRCLIRFTVNCGLDRAELDRIIDVCAEIRDEVGMAEWRSTQARRAAAQDAGSGVKAAVACSTAATAGNSIMKVVPTFIVDRHEIAPPQPSIIIRQNESPRPVPTPGRCADTNGMNT